MSNWFSRSPNTVFGSIRETVALPADRLRPSGVDPAFAIALEMLQFAASAGPGTVWKVPLIWTSYGSVYDPSSLRNGARLRNSASAAATGSSV